MMDPYGIDSDNVSVGSLAMLSEDGSFRQKNNDDDSEGSDSPGAIVRKKSRLVACTKYTMLFLLVGAGVFLAVSAYLIGKPEEQQDDEQEPEEDDPSATYAGIVGATFAVLILVFLRYDFLVARRNSLLLHMTKRYEHIVDSLFPSVVRNRLLKEAPNHGSNASGDDDTVDFAKLTKMNTKANQHISETAPIPVQTMQSHVNVKSYLASTPERKREHDAEKNGQPIADLFPNCTILFADIAGFTSWSADREPPQVFVLLETIYSEFDALGAQLKVFKVETIGDCYLAVTGLPDPDEGHAVAMCRFAYQCLSKFSTILKDLEAQLGPGTGDLQMRVGLHSGPVTAGVLRGQKSRFQLFGDTVNTASRMESTCMEGRIQVSQETADLLIAAGKHHWLKLREDTVFAKGKGEMRTYWLKPSKKNLSQSTQSEHSVYSSDQDHSDLPMSSEIVFETKKKKKKRATKPEKPPSDPKFVEAGPVSVSKRHISDEKYARLIDWNTDVLLQHLAAVATCRHTGVGATKSVMNVDHAEESSTMPPAFDSVADVIIFPTFDSFNEQRNNVSPTDLTSIRKDLHAYVAEIAAMYNNVPFHNFDHASHVTLAANKLVGRMSNSKTLDKEELHNATFGISSDPLTQFAIVFAALIHDVGHTGVPNAQLVKEEAEVALQYNNRSVAEQNSIRIAWQLLMQPRFQRLRSFIYKTNVERKRFRQVVINAVMATDIADRDIIQLRAKKWDKAFGENDERRGSGDFMTRDEINRKATVVIENVIQVADVAHTMQHYHIYRRWNERLFEEMVQAYRNGRASFDPASTWYNGEIGFFDHCVTPLARKMKACGVFGDQHLSNAIANRNQWEANGKEALQAMIDSLPPFERSDSPGFGNGWVGSGASETSSTVQVVESMSVRGNERASVDQVADCNEWESNDQEALQAMPASDRQLKPQGNDNDFDNSIAMSTREVESNEEAKIEETIQSIPSVNPESNGHDPESNDNNRDNGGSEGGRSETSSTQTVAQLVIGSRNQVIDGQLDESLDLKTNKRTAHVNESDPCDINDDASSNLNNHDTNGTKRVELSSMENGDTEQESEKSGGIGKNESSAVDRDVVAAEPPSSYLGMNFL